MAARQKRSRSGRRAAAAVSSLLAAAVAAYLLLLPDAGGPGREQRLSRVLRSNTSKKKPPSHTQQLEFIHIPKSGGTAVERAGGKAGISWGACHYINLNSFYGNRQDFGPGCGLRSDAPERLHPTAFRARRMAFRDKGRDVWHTPPHWLDPNPLEDKKTFTVVRDPYSRMLSSYRCRFHGYSGDKDKSLPSTLNWYVKARLKKPLEQVRRLETNRRLGAVDDKETIEFEQISVSSKAVIPQSHFVYDIRYEPIDDDDNEDGPRDHRLARMGKRIVDHVLKYETLQEDFAALMKTYDIDAGLTEEPTANAPNRAIKRKLTVHDFDAESRKLIAEFYKDDFVAFDYPTEIVEETRKDGRRTMAAERDYDGDLMPPEAAWMLGEDYQL